MFITTTTESSVLCVYIVFIHMFCLFFSCAAPRYRHGQRKKPSRVPPGYTPWGNVWEIVWEYNTSLLLPVLMLGVRTIQILCLLWIDEAKANIKPIYECRCNGRLQTKRFTRLSHTGLILEVFILFFFPFFILFGPVSKMRNWGRKWCVETKERDKEG